MKLVEAAKMGIFCGLRSPEEWIRNIRIHGSYLLPYDTVEKEMKELYKEYDEYCAGIITIDVEAIEKECDKELDDYFKQEGSAG